MSIYVSGSIAYDRIMNFPGKFADHILPEKIHILNVCFLIDRLEEKRGGTAGNIAYSLALMGETPHILCCVGKDFDRYAEELDRLGLPQDGIRRLDDQFTAGAYITTDQSDNQITGFNPAAMRFPCEYPFPALDAKADIAIVSPGNVDDMVGLPRMFRERGVRYIFDPGQQIPALSGDQLYEAICGAHMLVTNDYELEMIMKATGRTKAELLEHTGWIITTMSEHGSRIDNGSPVLVPAVKADRVLDPTGAGDAYRAGLIKGLVDGKDVTEAARMGATCASFCVEHYGTQEHAFTPEQFAARHNAAFGG
ncbi:carbohydrate kinase family protein [Nitratidesulfovibrio liaohensis]|uniref:carbohydrate kinase family protein n=1 Tax=Nitratidesulfovibrio liaohensis TaxID=2604158 RepID=UPI001422D7D1|nr:carbohydrate kinase family protein [Nitratidesulfovibrio liaohensis]NHZ45901.1 carbohydrate kinase family protein [Nitratidesulfovibrio liaohensis]